jgi:hypothetical protein
LKFEEFIRLVSEMRDAQRAWFRDGKHWDLTRSKQLERAVDRALAELTTDDKQARLF